jgi:hypothetical protein
LAESKLKIEYVALNKLVRWPRNPKDHSIGDLTLSFERFGYVNPIIVDERSGKLIAGHGRIDALQQMKLRGESAPRNIQVKGDDWLVPVVRGVSFESESEAEAYLVADNQLTISGAWDDAKLAAILSDLAAQDALSGTGFDADDVDDLLKRINGEEKTPKEPKDLGALGEMEFRIVVECANEQEQATLLERFEQEGLRVKALIS